MRRLSRVLFAAFALALLPAASCKLNKPEPRVSPRVFSAAGSDKGFRKTTADDPPAFADALFQLLDDDKKQYKAAFDDLPTDAQPSQATKALKKYAEGLEQNDLSAFPEEFKAAHKRFRVACDKLVTSLGFLPDDAEGARFRDALTALLKGEPDKGKSLGGNVVESAKAVKTTRDQLFSAALKTGGLEPSD